jgi:hypothetical protein
MKSEVRALEQAVCSLVTKLDILLTAEFGLRLLDVSHGLHISIPDHLSEYKDDAFVAIRPVGWPKGSSIQARFFWGANGWNLYHYGEISADHLRIPVGSIRFTPSEEGLGIQLEPTELQKWVVVSGYTRLISSLQRDVAVHQ